MSRLVHGGKEKQLRRRTEAAGFTLVELLVIVAIVAILAALLLPSLSKSLTLSRECACSNNLRQLGMLFQVYFDNNHDFFPNPEKNKWKVVYADGVNELLCPGQEGSWVIAGAGTNASGPAQAYSVNGNVQTTGTLSFHQTLPFHLSRRTLSSNTAMLFEKVWSIWSSPPYYSGGRGFIDSTRHRSHTSSNVGYFDGHVGFRDVFYINNTPAGDINAFWLGK